MSEIIPFPAGHTVLQTETAAFAQDSDNWRRLDFRESKIIVHAVGDETIEMEITLD